MGAVMTLFLGLTAVCGVIGPAQDGVTLRAAKYAADSLLPVVGGDIADAMDGMAASASLVRSSAGVTGVLVMLAVCVRPVIRLTLGLLICRLSAALSEPVADGPLVRCAEQLGKATGLLLAAVAVSAALFVTLAGVCVGAR
jgi:stage III sporulation protein AE